MTIRELIDELSKSPPDMPVFVACTPGHDYYPLEHVVPHEDTDDDYVLLAGPFDD